MDYILKSNRWHNTQPTAPWMHPNLFWSGGGWGLYNLEKIEDEKYEKEKPLIQALNDTDLDVRREAAEARSW